MEAWKYFTSQNQWKDYLKNLLKTNDKALLRAIVLIYDNQTLEEKTKGKSIDDNHVGFSKIDAKEMGDIARKIKAKKPLTRGEIVKSRNKMQKYWKQLMIISKEQTKAKEEAKLIELEAKLIELETQEENAEKLKQFKQDIETLRKCSEEGIACEYGICDECPITTGFQLRFKC